MAAPVLLPPALRGGTLPLKCAPPALPPATGAPEDSSFSFCPVKKAHSRGFCLRRAHSASMTSRAQNSTTRAEVRPEL